MPTLFEPSLSTSTMRPPLSSADALSMADSLPNINFGFEELRDRMAKFTVKFDAFIEQGRKRVLEERNQFCMNVAELHEDQRMKKKDIEIWSSKSSTHQQLLAKEAAETNEMQTAIASLSAQREAHNATRESLKQQIADTQKQIDARAEAQRTHAKYIDAQSRYNIPELDFYASNLCMSIDGGGLNDHLVFTFTHIDDHDWTHEAMFELNTGKREYEIPYTKPKLERERVERLLDKLNETRDLRYLFKGMRELFVEAIKE
ncbi:chromosome segregation protein Spc25-domain-containing protein [Calycina marina]|uniref:Kinetochore protein SPC25 n=1 Tax=Calycina marina TaxID=1763456 RepID=A0A9P7ZB61_9HELO|nr:chromosome segregation protein Spc25-domain-containing protein [Calycina marina]